ncbi:hypothetical protein SAMN04487867_10458 [Vreelandella titanicae]|uniref:hypothetical protein n=1 Tax=Vreelandella titanicae TaxID=664683 RepID=UPI0008804E9B|nr:hypothetical protein [Halomonas titanicae]SDI27793.1 hypothetical protein SAMN04487867_10458 [Halomonas titanicae]
MPTYVVAKYNGEIAQVITGGARYIKVPDGEDIADDTHYVDTQTDAVLAKSELEFKVSVDGLAVTIDGLPEDLTVTANNMQVMTDSTPLVVIFDVPGAYSIELGGRIDYLSQVVEVAVGDA